METRRWTNPSQPQTLQMAVWLLYLNGVLSILGFNTFALLFGLGLAGGAFGIANDKKWGYYLALGITGVELLFLVWAAGGLSGLVTDFRILVSLLFVGGRAALLLHPMSRDYQRVWFR